MTARRRELGVEDDLAALENMTPTILVWLGEGGIKTRDDLADLTGDEVRFLTLGQETEQTLDDLAQMDAHSIAVLVSGSPLASAARSCTAVIPLPWPFPALRIRGVM